MSEIPQNADFAIYIDFEPGTESPEAIFQAIDHAIRLFRELDQILCKTIDSKIEPTMFLEEIESGSLKVWIRYLLESVDDDVLKNLNWRPLLGNFLVKGKYAIIEWTNQDCETTVNVNSIGRIISKLADKTGVSELPFYRKIDSNDLAMIPDIMDRIKTLLLNSASIKYLTHDKEIEVNPSMKIAPVKDMKTAPVEDMTFRSVKHMKTEDRKFLPEESSVTENSNLILLVKRPVYIGSANWVFMLNNKTISAPVEDSGWLEKFRSREVDLRPGDALRCTVRIETEFDYDKQFLSTKYFIVYVDEVIN